MSGEPPELTQLETLPLESLSHIVDFLALRDIKSLSRSSKWLRVVCMPVLFRCVRFRFALAGFKELGSFLESDFRRYVASFTYVIPELLRTELLDFDRFRTEILSPDRYVDLAKDLYDADCENHKYPLYMAIYKAVHRICREQRSIIDEGVDLVLSSVFGALPQLKEVRLSFWEVLEEYNWVPPSLVSGMIIQNEFYKHHLQVVSSAIQSARSNGVALDTVTLLDFVSLHDRRRIPVVDTLEESLGQLLEHVKILRLRGFDCVVELLSYSEQDRHQLGVCHVDKVLMGFIEAIMR